MLRSWGLDGVQIREASCIEAVGTFTANRKMSSVLVRQALPPGRCPSRGGRDPPAPLCLHVKVKRGIPPPPPPPGRAGHRLQVSVFSTHTRLHLCSTSRRPDVSACDGRGRRRLWCLDAKATWTARGRTAGSTTARLGVSSPPLGLVILRSRALIPRVAPHPGLARLLQRPLLRPRANLSSGPTEFLP